MKTKKQKYNWLVDATLFSAFLLSFWLELTGIELHQWLGVAIGSAAGYHLLTHWNWVRAVTDRFFKRTSGQARLYYVIDAAMLIGLLTIGVTGLVISTWVDLALTNFSTWKTIHVIASIGTLGVLVAKLGLHWRWIVSTARRYIFPRQPQPAPAPASTGIGRREFLHLMGGVSAVAVIAAGSAVHELTQTAPAATSTITPSTQSESASPSTGSVSAQSQSADTCVVRCQRRCSYPGHCRRYTDSNNNGRCDLGECM
ncbi:MAG TPA: DUF4405 domain-containing protein [Anaerolineae bacterium]|nr:DUF4405 domain-containing protein [Anaerolineae bacterium]